MTAKLTFLCLVSMLATAALADDEVHPFISSKYSIQLGAFLPSKDFNLSVDGSVTGTNQEFDFEKATGLRSSDEVFMLEFKWRFGEKWSARLQYYEADDSKKAVLKEDITWQDQGLLAGSSITAGVTFHLSRVFFGRSFVSRPNVDAGIGLGVHWLEIGAFIKPDFITTFGDVSAASVSGPLPNIGIGLKYQFFRLAVDVDDDKWHGRAELDYEGPFIYLSAN